MRSLFESNASTNKTIARLCEMVKTETISHEGNDDPTWAENVVKTLAKRLKKAKYLDELAKAIITEDRYSNCCAIPNDVDKKKTLRKNQSHLLYIKLWRFPWLKYFLTQKAKHRDVYCCFVGLIVNCVRCVMRCRYPFSKKADLICINPYHYEPIHAKAPPLPPIVVNKKAGYYHTTPATINALSNHGFAVQPYDDWKSGGWSMRTMAWKDDLLAMGDAEGRVVIWDLGRRQSRHVRASRFPVMRMTFSRLAGDHTLAVLYQRELSLWDTAFDTTTSEKGESQVDIEYRIYFHLGIGGHSRSIGTEESNAVEPIYWGRSHLQSAGYHLLIPVDRR
nr:MAD homology 1 domain containing protein [Haemonchus contortus]